MKSKCTFTYNKIVVVSTSSGRNYPNSESDSSPDSELESKPNNEKKGIGKIAKKLRNVSSIKFLGHFFYK